MWSSFFDPSGRICAVRTANQPSIDGLGRIETTTPCPGSSHYVDGQGAIAARPPLVLPAPEVELGRDWIIADAPPGTEIRLDGALIGVTETQGPLSIAFPAAATYALTLCPPWPCLEAEITVTVNAA